MAEEPDDQGIQPGEPRAGRSERTEPRDDFDRDSRDQPRRRRPQQPDDVVSSVIPYRNGLALGGYYTGVFSLIPCLGLILGPIALVLGILGLGYANKHPEARGKGHAITAIVLGGLTTFGHLAVFALIGLAAMAG